MRNTALVLALIVVGITAVASAQQAANRVGSAPAMAVGTTPEQTSVALGGKTIAVKYFAASMKGQKVLGGVVPLKRVWPIGGASPALFHTDGDLAFKGIAVPSGDYSLYLLADADKWQLIINKQTGQNASTYNPKMDVGRVPMTLRASTAPADTCKVTLSRSASRAAKLELALENTIGSASFALDWVPGDSEW